MNSNSKNVVTLSFVRSSTDAGLLLLRVWLGVSMFLIHGLGKLQKFDTIVSMFQEKLGIPAPLAVAAIVAETLCALLLVLGLATRWAALFLVITMGVAFTKAHGFNLTPGDPKSGEIAFLYLAGFATLLIAGAGRLSVDGKITGTCCSGEPEIASPGGANARS
jgi:putative oxidoreductase